jgi:hypothetical protein
MIQGLTFNQSFIREIGSYVDRNKHMESTVERISSDTDTTDSRDDLINNFRNFSLYENGIKTLGRYKSFYF